jgi:hypothetical protein
MMNTVKLLAAAIMAATLGTSASHAGNGWDYRALAETSERHQATAAPPSMEAERSGRLGMMAGRSDVEWTYGNG